jgi:hypothetical protein
MRQLSATVFINGAPYMLDELPFIASVPLDFFTKEDGLDELNQWLVENTEDVWWICFHNRTVRFKSESDATYMKLVLG